MARHIIIYDDFLADPDRVRDEVLREGFVGYSQSTYAGKMSKPFIRPEVGPLFASLVGRPMLPKIEHSWYGQFRLSTESDRCDQWIHLDPEEWSVLVYMNPEGTYPEGYGTAFWTHKRTGWERYPGNWRDLADVSQELRDEGFNSYEAFKQRIVLDDGQDESQWTKTLHVPAKYNRALLFRPHYFHSHMPKRNFGKTPEDGRLVQLYFFEEL